SPLRAPARLAIAGQRWFRGRRRRRSQLRISHVHGRARAQSGARLPRRAACPGSPAPGPARRVRHRPEEPRHRVRRMDQAVYTVSDRRYFLGTVALLNSLRLLGHTDPVFLVDAGLSDEQRDIISGHVTLIPAPEAVPALFLKVLGPLSHPADVAVLLDADVIVVRPLHDLIDAARSGRMVAFINNEPNHDRFFTDWGQTLALGPLQRRPYLANGQLWIPHSLSERVLQPCWDVQHKVDIRRTWVGTGTLLDPFYFAEMDVFNAVVAA